MNFSGEMRRSAQALASVFSINPPTDYRASYPRRSAAEMMDRAWERTMSDRDSTFEGTGHGDRRR